MQSIIRKAFTLIELLVVIAIIGILSGLIVVTMSGVTQKANIAKSQVFSNSLKNTLMLNLVSEWKLDANANDSWSGNNSGSIVGATSNTTDCVYGSCYSFDGNGDYILIPTNSNQDITDAVTISAWVKTTANQPNTYPFIFGKHWRYTLRINQNTNNVYFTILKTEGSMEASTSMPLNQWNFIVGTYDKNSGGKIYVNSRLANSVISTGAIAIAAAPMYFGVADLGWTSVGFVGSIDETRVYNAAVPASQIKKEYYAGLNSLLAGGSISKEEYNQRIIAIIN